MFSGTGLSKYFTVIRYTPETKNNNCNYSDLCSDGYAILLAKEMGEKDSLASSFQSIFENQAGKEFAAILSINADNEIPLIRSKVSKVVEGVVSNLLSNIENGFKDSNKDVKDACIDVFAYWLHFQQ